MRTIHRTLLAAGLGAAPLIVLAATAKADTAPVTHEVRMIAAGTAMRFEPAALTIKPGDRVRFVNVSGGPHNVSFDPARVPDDVERVLSAAMAQQIQPLWGPLMSDANASYTIAFTGVKPGTYEFFCMPHMAMGMKGTLTVR